MGEKTQQHNAAETDAMWSATKRGRNAHGDHRMTKHNKPTSWSHNIQYINSRRGATHRSGLNNRVHTCQSTNNNMLSKPTAVRTPDKITTAAWVCMGMHVHQYTMSSHYHNAYALCASGKQYTTHNIQYTTYNIIIIGVGQHTPKRTK